MKTLEAIQTLSKLGRIFSKIICICSIVGAIGCAVGIVSLPFADKGLFKLGGVSIYGLISSRADIALNNLYPLFSGAAILCIGQAVTARVAESYFKNELTAGTPFTLSGAKELLRLGIVTICVPLGSIILSRIVSSIIAELLACGELFDPNGFDSVALGVMFIVMSLLCSYGAEEAEKHKNAK